MVRRIFQIVGYEFDYNLFLGVMENVFQKWYRRWDFTDDIEIRDYDAEQISLVTNLIAIELIDTK